MAEPFFKIVIVLPAVGAPAFLGDTTFKNAFKKRITDEFNTVASKSKNDNVKTGFGLDFMSGTNEDATKDSASLPPTLFRAHLVPGKFDKSAIIALNQKIAPHLDNSRVEAQMKAEGGLGGRTKSGENMALASTGPIEQGTLFDQGPNLKHMSEAGRQLGGLVAHELGHAMGISQNQGKGLMYGIADVNIDQQTVISTVHFEESDIKLILATLENIAVSVRSQQQHPASPSKSNSK